MFVTIPGMYSTGDYPFYLWENLEADTKYSFVVSACNGFTRECGSPSRHVEATTEDGLSSQVSKVNNPVEVEVGQVGGPKGGREGPNFFRTTKLVCFQQLG